MAELACPNCKNEFPGYEQCPACGLYLVISDPRPPYIPRGTVGDRISQLWTSTVEAASGRQPASVLVKPVDEIVAPLKQGIEDPHCDPTLRQYMEATIYYLEHVKSFAETHSVPRLNMAWVELIGAASGMHEAAEAVGIDMSGSDSSDPSDWRSSVGSFFNTTDTVQFTDPDE